MRYSVIIRVGEHESKDIELLSEDSKVINVPFLNCDFSAKNRVKHEYIIDGLNRFRLIPSNLAMDLLVLSVGVLSADTRINRGNESEDSWTREIDLYVPVSAPAIWNNQKENISVILGFLTGDRWRVSFRDGDYCYKGLFKNKRKKKATKPFKGNIVSLFSGGMDSFIGAIDLLENDFKPFLVGHRKSADVGGPQKKAYEYLEQQYSNRVGYVPFRLNTPKKIFHGGEEKSERGRSFVFLSLGILVASALKGKSKLVVPENGLISLNVPLSPLRLGSLSTRTTHPYYLKRFQQLIDSLGLNISIENPYRFKTKGEMLSECKNNDRLKGFISRTRSGAHPAAGRFRKDVGIGHCGVCVPCIIRKASFNKAKKLITDSTDYKGDLTNVANRKYIQPFLRSIKRLNDNSGIEKYLILKSGPMFDYSQELGNYSDVYRRGMKEIEDLFACLNSC